MFYSGCNNPPDNTSQIKQSAIDSVVNVYSDSLQQKDSVIKVYADEGDTMFDMLKTDEADIQKQSEIFYIAANLSTLYSDDILRSLGTTTIIHIDSTNINNFSQGTTEQLFFPTSNNIVSVSPYRDPNCFTITDTGVLINDPKLFWLQYKYCIIITN